MHYKFTDLTATQFLRRIDNLDNKGFFMDDITPNQTPQNGTLPTPEIKPDFSVKTDVAAPAPVSAMSAPELPKAPVLPTAPVLPSSGMMPKSAPAAAPMVEPTPSVSLPRADTSKTFVGTPDRAVPIMPKAVFSSAPVKTKDATSIGAVLIDCLSAVVAISFAVLIILDV